MVILLLQRKALTAARSHLANSSCGIFLSNTGHGKVERGILKLNTNAEIEIQLSDSTTGMNSVMEGTCDIGMASRELKESELKRLKPIVGGNRINFCS